MDIVSHELQKAKADRAEISISVIGRDLRLAWESFLQDFGRAHGKLIALALNDERTRPFGHRLKNNSQRDDEGLVFLREARNQDEDGLEPSAAYEEGVTRLFGNAIALGPNCERAEITNCNFNGHQIKRMVLSTYAAGRISSLETSDPVLAAYDLARIRLRPIWNERKRKHFAVPKSLGGVKIDPVTPENIAEMATKYLEDAIAEHRRCLAGDD